MAENDLQIIYIFQFFKK